MEAHAFASELMDLLLGEDPDGGLLDPVNTSRVETFSEAGVLTWDAGVVVTMKGHREFQITMQQSRPASRPGRR